MNAMLREMKRTAKRCWLRCRPHALILMYHRVADLESDPQLLAVSPKHFAEHLQVIRNTYHPLHLTELVQALSSHQMPRRGIVMTFDDGYVDNLYNATPLLKQFHIPATVFVTAGLIGQSQELWWDELERLLLLPGVFSKELSLRIQGQYYVKKLGQFREYRQDDYIKYCSWNILSADEPTVRHTIYRELHNRLRQLLPAERDNILRDIGKQIEQGRNWRESYRMMREEELRTLCARNLCEVGAHTMTHPALSMMSQLEQMNEIQQSKSSLERIIEKPVTNFSYPYGGRDDYTPETIEILRQCGFLSACSTLLDVVFPYADCFQLPRLVVRNWSGEIFARQLAEWF
ncbi:polysaccharide deacetylase [Candidatus Moduliflexus flocculans]|uniref:Polysaccharide deacetylase n=1 Tax=Candidatus Moduliflexus flocculans TaxID=1499966 RepID=A0A081BMV8_9BACT|nr:polysaccharide deacetylase [Candidatus Moduliflexus flocculans]